MIIKTLISIVVIVICYFTFLSFSTRQDAIKAASERQLTPCPNKPNCVLSSSTVKREAIDPLPLLNNDIDLSWLALLQVIKQSGGSLLIDDHATYLHASYTSTLFRFKDDLEAQFLDNKIHIRSASRAGKSDLGKNRQRIEQIRTLYLAHEAIQPPPKLNDK